MNKLFPLSLVVVVSATLGLGWLAFQQWRDDHGTKWTIEVRNERDKDLVVAGIKGSFNETTRYVILAPRSSTVAEVSHEDEPPDAVIFDLASHRDADGELVVVPVWDPQHRAIVCSWQNLQGVRQIVVREDSQSCADLLAQ